MEHQHVSVAVADQASRIYRFDEVYPLAAAQEQAEKKKLAAFGLLAKLNPLNRPKESTVMLSRHEKRYEPFWHIVAQREVDYETLITYPVAVQNPHASKVSIDGRVWEVARQNDRASRIEIEAVEHCHRKLTFDRLIDGLERDLRAKTLEAYRDRYKYSEVDQVEDSGAVRPLVAQQGAVNLAKSELLGQAINANVVQHDQITFDKIHLYWRPVFAFEFVWSTADRRGVIEVDGLTGEVKEDGHWFKDKLDKILTREMLIDASSELAGAFVPGGAIAVKLIGRVTE